MPKPLPVKRVYFPRVVEARQALQARAEKWADDYNKIIEAAMKRDLEVAAKAIQWAFEHMPADEGVTVIDQSVDKPKPTDGTSGPTIKIGFALGGLASPLALPPASEPVQPALEVIDEEPEEPEPDHKDHE